MTNRGSALTWSSRKARILISYRITHEAALWISIGHNDTNLQKAIFCQMSAQPDISVAQLIVRCLENEGVKYIFGIPGEENIHLTDAFNDSSIRFILVRHEQ